jgi:hypothetical protein
MAPAEFVDQQRGVAVAGGFARRHQDGLEWIHFAFSGYRGRYARGAGLEFC